MPPDNTIITDGLPPLRSGGTEATPSCSGTKADKRLITREADRLVAIVMGRADPRTVVCHYLIVERGARAIDGPCGAPEIREIEQYRDLERVVSIAADCETGDRVNCQWKGGFTATYRDGLLVGVKIIKGMDKRVAREIAKRPSDRLSPLNRHDNMLRPAAEELASGLGKFAAAGLQQSTRDDEEHNRLSRNFGGSL